MNKEEIEELAFKDRKELANLNELYLLEIIEFLQNDRKQWTNQFTQTRNESIDIQKENQELKKQLENCYCNRTDCSGRIKNSRNYDSLYQKYNKQLDNWNKLKEDLIKIRKLTFTKYNKNEWENCLSFNDDILPLIEKMKELERSDE